MEIVSEGKNFRLVQDDELPEIMNYLEKFMPEASKFHQTIKTYLNDRVWQFYFYVAKDWPNQPVCLHFPGCTLSPNDNIYESFGIFCPSNQIEFVDLFSTEDILIDWKLPLYMNFTHVDIVNRIEKLYSAHGVVYDKIRGDIYECKGGIPNKLELDSLPSDEVEMRPLKTDNAKAIHDLYPASEIESVAIFEKLINKLPGFGIYCMTTGELAAWMVQSYYGAMFSMQTRPEFRRKGYGIHLAQSLTKLVIERGYKPFVVIRPENDASRSLYTKLGFVKHFETMRAKFRPFDENNDDDTIKINKNTTNGNSKEVALTAMTIDDDKSTTTKSPTRPAQITTNNGNAGTNDDDEDLDGVIEK